MGAPGVNDRVAIREVGMRDSLQSIAEIMPSETKLAWLDAGIHSGGARDRGHLVCAAKTAAAIGRCRSGGGARADAARLTVSWLTWLAGAKGAWRSGCTR